MKIIFKQISQAQITQTIIIEVEMQLEKATRLLETARQNS